MAAPSLTFLKSSINCCVPQTTPPTASLLPLMNFVKLCMTMSAPSFFGEIDKGEKVVIIHNGKILESGDVSKVIKKTKQKNIREAFNKLVGIKT